MKILNVTSITEMRGGDAQMYTIYTILKDKSDLKQFILCPEDSILADICQKDTANYFTYKKNSLKFFNLVSSIIKICKKENIDVIHIHDSTALNAGLVAFHFLKKSTSLILSRKRNNKIKDKFLNRFKYSHPSIQKIICVSKAVETIFENIITNKNRLVTIYDAIDVEKFENKASKNILHNEFNFTKDTFIIGNIAGLTKQKDLYTFIDAAKKVKEKNDTKRPIKFVVIGDGILKNELIAYAEENNLENDIFFTGFRNNINELLPEFDVFLITSITEGLPLSVYEAMASKVPIVATKAGGIPEVIVNGETGFLSNIKDSGNLSSNVLKILNDKKLTENIKTNSLNKVRKYHNLSVIKENYYNFYKSLWKEKLVLK